MNYKTELGVRFLALLDAISQRDQSRVLWNGVVSVGIRGTAADTWWTARFEGGRVTTHFDEAIPHGSTVTVLLGATEAESILHEGRLPAQPQLFEMEGDRSLFRRFLDTLFERKTVLGLRAGI